MYFLVKGEARSSIAPLKPQRSASIRDFFYKEGESNNTCDFPQDTEPQV